MTSVVDEAEATWLVGAEGLATLSETVARLDAGASAGSVLDGLRRSGIPGGRASLVLEAAEARRRARTDHPEAERLVFTRRSLEQASQPRVAAWRARRYRGVEAFDLCAGAGTDAAAIARTAARVVAVEHDPGRAVLLRHNLDVLAPDAEVRCVDALTVPVPPAAAVHVDPDRRDDGRRLVDPSRYRPDVRALDARLRASNALGVTMGPGVDLDHPLLVDAEIEFVQLGRRLVEAVRWTGALRHDGARASATLLPEGLHLRGDGVSGAPLPVRPIGRLLLEPAPALVRARLHDRLGEGLGPDVGRVATRSALLTADTAPSSPWLRRREVLAVLAARPRAVRTHLARFAETEPVELALHGLTADLEAWWRDLGRPPRGPEGLRIDLVRLDRGARAVLSRCDAGDRPSGDDAR